MYEKVFSGQPVGKSPLRKAAFVNDMIDSVADFNARRLGEPTTPSGLKFPTDLVKVRNSTGGDRQRGDCVQLGDYLLDDLDFRKAWFDCDLPADPILRRFAIVLNPLPEDEIGLAQVDGCCLTRVNVGNVLHTHAMSASGADELVSCFGGPVELLSNPDGTGSQEMFVRLAVGLDLIYGKADSDIAARSGETAGNGTVSIWKPNTSGVFSDTTVNHTAYNLRSSVVEAAKYIAMQREIRNGLLMVINEDLTTIARFIEFTLPSALTTSDASKASCTVIAYWGGTNPGSTVTVYNYVDVAGGYQWEGSSGAHGYAIWDDELDRYRIIDLNCPS